MNGRRATTMPELIIASGVLSLLLTGVVLIFVKCNEYFHISETKIQIQTELIRAITRLNRDLSEANASSLVGAGNATTGIAMASPRGPDGRYSYDSQGRMLWQDQVGYYLTTVGDNIPALVRQDKWVTPPALEPFLGIQLSDVQASTTPPTVMARYISDFTVQQTASVAQVSLTCHLVSYGKDFGLKLVAHTLMRN